MDITYTIDYNNIPVEITRKNIKNMYIRVLPPDGSVAVSAPHIVPTSYIIDFLDQKASWIKDQRTKILSSQGNVLFSADGNTIKVWGARRPLVLSYDTGIPSIELCDEMVIISVPPGTSEKVVSAVVENWYKQLLSGAILEYLPKWENITGLHCSSCHIRTMKTRWGSCTPSTRRIRLNTRLVEFPVACLEYVILHELIHLKIPDHGPKFKASLDRFMPNWRHIRGYLCGG